MLKIPDCSRCLLYAHDPHLVCGVHPAGVETDCCPNFQLDPDAEPEEFWEPVGASYYNSELILHRPRLRPADQMALLDWHPLFTGRCPGCEMPMVQHDLVSLHWDCVHCGWVDDSV